MFLRVFSPRSTKSRVDPAAHVVVGRARDQDAARVAKALEPRRDIDAVAENVVAFDQHVPKVDAYAIDDALRLRHVGVALDHQLLDRDRAFDRCDNGGKFEQQPIARRLDDAPPEVRHQRPRRLAMLPDRLRRPRLVLAHQPRVADDVGSEDRGEFSGFAHSSGSPALRRTSNAGWRIGLRSDSHLTLSLG